ncbi:DNA-binding protein [Lactococcus lactis]|uniref:DNA-binding protein n=1 Tax=Lactococcus lactis TaxID=1358 RepID=UPI002891B0EC|nr:DNA-binding protein [Lactococcus lactis]MDT2882627.1 DNA-binding protein [Lactococcus lactis]
MSEELKTAKKIAKSLNVSDMTVYRIIKKHNIQPTIKEKNSSLYDTEKIQYISDILNNTSNSNTGNSNTSNSNTSNSNTSNSNTSNSNTSNSNTSNSNTSNSNTSNSNTSNSNTSNSNTSNSNTSNSNTSNSNTSNNDRIVNILENQLKQKDTQIAQMQNLLDQQQRLALQDKKLLEEYKSEINELKSLKMPQEDMKDGSSIRGEAQEEIERLKAQLKLSEEERNKAKEKEPVKTESKKWWGLWRK